MGPVRVGGRDRTCVKENLIAGGVKDSAAKKERKKNYGVMAGDNTPQVVTGGGERMNCRKKKTAELGKKDFHWPARGRGKKKTQKLWAQL